MRNGKREQETTAVKHFLPHEKYQTSSPEAMSATVKTVVKQQGYSSRHDELKATVLIGTYLDSSVSLEKYT